MARRPAASNNSFEILSTLQNAFSAGQNRAPVTDVALPGDAGVPIQTTLGQRLREIRKRHELSIRALASRSGLAVNTLSMIENDKTSPSVSTLQILARVLDVPITAFFEQELVEKKVVYVRQTQRPMIHVDTTRLEHLGLNLAGSIVQPFVVTLEPGSDSGQKRIVHTGHEFVYCLSGQVLYSIEEQTYLLAPGDSLVFGAHLPHAWQNASSDLAQLILVLIPSDVRDTPAELHFPLE